MEILHNFPLGGLTPPTQCDTILYVKSNTPTGKGKSSPLPAPWGSSLRKESMLCHYVNINFMTPPQRG